MDAACVCISGATHGIGFGIAEAFARTGARLVINAERPDSAALARLNALTECHFVLADLSSVAGARNFIEESHDRLGRLDTLVNNAGTFQDVDFLDLEEAQFAKTFDLNVRGYLFAGSGICAAGQPGSAQRQHYLCRVDQFKSRREKQRHLRFIERSRPDAGALAGG
ncbi:SDR family NAD(P)-dependent oxidoreductase [Devosia algicola]|uniref:SDR family NAD(P)-dependent oxidoreductase n=1 Tax=Devosia algicola TaxID=3026418 RepID=A0ABY7YNX0_9HYPH|nr:SDR family oxidoreductase [Devosia algicola]WDR02595.1 SDR family NAD(P)-dependent oxidoreductase [Devosia algicola]